MAVHKSAGLILRCQDWSETSQVVHLLAREVGRIRCLAKGSKRERNPFGGPLDRWTLGEAVFSLGDPNRLATLMELYPTERFAGLTSRLPAYFGASMVTELVLTLVPEADPEPALFDLVVEALRQLAEGEADACRAVTYAFAWRLLRRLGYGPDMGRCAECGRPLGTSLSAGTAVTFSAAVGGPVCGRCRPKGGTFRLSGRAAEAIRFLAGADWEKVRRVRLREPTADQIRTALAERVRELGGQQPLAIQYV